MSSKVSESSYALPIARLLYSDKSTASANSSTLFPSDLHRHNQFLTGVGGLRKHTIANSSTHNIQSNPINLCMASRSDDKHSSPDPTDKTVGKDGAFNILDSQYSIAAAQAKDLAASAKNLDVTVEDAMLQAEFKQMARLLDVRVAELEQFYIQENASIRVQRNDAACKAKSSFKRYCHFSLQVTLWCYVVFISSFSDV